MVIGMFFIGLGTGLLVGLLIGLAVGVRQRHEIAAAVRTFVAPVDGPPCVVCGEPANPVRFHDGRYLCKAHKG